MNLHYFLRQQSLLLNVNFEYSSGTNSQLWTSDGTDVGTNPYSGGFGVAWFTGIHELIGHNGEWYFIGYTRQDDDYLTGLWKNVPGESVSLIKNFNFEAVGQTRPRGLVSVDEHMFFTADDGSGHGTELWVSDGTEDGTGMLHDLWPGEASSWRHRVWSQDGQIYFVAASGVNGNQSRAPLSLWTTNGFSEGTKRVMSLPAGSVSEVATSRSPNESDVTFVTIGGESESSLWMGSEDTFIQIASFTRATQITLEAIAGDSLYFTRLQPRADREPQESLWAYDVRGNRLGRVGDAIQFVDVLDNSVIVNQAGSLFAIDVTTQERKLIHDDSFTAGMEPSSIAVVNDDAYFISENDGHVYQVRPAQDGAQHFRRIHEPDSFRSEAVELRVAHAVVAIGDDVLVFSQLGMWKYSPSDGQSELMTNASAIQNSIVSLDDEVYFIHDKEIWRTDGTLEGTKRIAHANNLWPFWEDEFWHQRLVLAGEHIYAVAPFANLWSNSQRLKYLAAGVVTIGNAGDQAYFISRNRGTSDLFGLWATEGFEASNVELAAFSSSASNASEQRFSNLHAFEGNLYFGENGMLWKYDTESIELVILKEFTQEWTPSYFANAGGKLFFAAGTAATGRELWVTDGTTEGTVLAADIRPGKSGSNPTELTATETELFFAADDGVTGNELWKIDLTTRRNPGDANNDGTVDIKDFWVLAENFGQLTLSGFDAGDFDENGIVDFRDFLVLVEKFEGADQ